MAPLNRRQFLRSATAAALAMSTADLFAQPATTPATTRASGKIDRRNVVTRHHVTLNAVEPRMPMQVGNGSLSFCCDVTGLQTLSREYHVGVPLQTIANWAWHRDPNPNNFWLTDLRQPYEVGGRVVPYYHDVAVNGRAPANTYLRSNPHRVPLANIGFVLDGVPIPADMIGDIAQTLELYAGTIRSRFTVRGERVDVVTIIDPVDDVLAVRVESALKDLAIRIAFPGATEDDVPPAYRLQHVPGPRMATFDWSQDDAAYRAGLAWQGDGVLARSGETAFDLPVSGGRLAFTMAYESTPTRIENEPVSFDDVLSRTTTHWEGFWNSGAAIDFSACTDTRAAELERRVVLSQYLTAINCAGNTPTPTSGLVYNRNAGKFALDTHWWHAAHFALWDRFPLLERSLGYYQSILPNARAMAKLQGYDGARWPRWTDLSGIETPSPVGAFVIWHQPHPIYFAELAYRAKPTRETLDTYADLVESSAQFMGSYARWDENAYVLGPALVPMQQTYSAQRKTLLNPTFELAYWAWGLGVAQKWRERLGLARNAHWDDVIAKLARPTIIEGRYASIQTEPQLDNRDHPSFLGALGLVPRTRLIDERTMRESARWTLQKWKWNTAWGSDFAMLAQTAARVGDPDLAIDALNLESVKNTFNTLGHNTLGDVVPVNLPGNGALLAAIALMAGGWDGMADNTPPAPGFPKDGRWNVKVEGFRPVP